MAAPIHTFIVTKEWIVRAVNEGDAVKIASQTDPTLVRVYEQGAK